MCHTRTDKAGLAENFDRASHPNEAVPEHTVQGLNLYCYAVIVNITKTHCTTVGKTLFILAPLLL